MIREDGWLNIVSTSEIESILRFIFDSKTLLRMEAQDGSLSMITTILDIDARAMTVGNPSGDTVGRQFIKAGSALLEVTLKGMQISFVGAKITPTKHTGQPALRMALPKRLKRVQRREFPRIEVPAKNPALCALPTSTQPEGKVKLALRDISAGGLALVDSRSLLDAAWGTQYKGCQLELPDVGWVEVGLRVAHSNDTPLGNGKIDRNVGCVFVDISDTTLMLIRHYAWRLEQMRA